MGLQAAQGQEGGTWKWRMAGGGRGQEWRWEDPENNLVLFALLLRAKSSLLLGL